MSDDQARKRIEEAQRIVARYGSGRDLAELIAERRAEVAAEFAEATYTRADVVRMRRQSRMVNGKPSAGDAPIEGGAATQTAKSQGGD
jgi:hypothetical protein